MTDRFFQEQVLTKTLSYSTYNDSKQLSHAHINPLFQSACHSHLVTLLQPLRFEQEGTVEDLSGVSAGPRHQKPTPRHQPLHHHRHPHQRCPPLMEAVWRNLPLSKGMLLTFNCFTLAHLEYMPS